MKKMIASSMKKFVEDMNSNFTEVQTSYDQRIATTDSFELESVISDKIQNSVVTTDKFADNNVLASKIQNESIYTEKFADNTIDIGKLQDSNLRKQINILKSMYITKDLNQIFKPNSIILYYE